jgi:hypothetical protein
MLAEKAKQSLIGGVVGGSVGHALDLLHLKDWAVGKLIGRSFGQTIESRASSSKLQAALKVEGEVISPTLTKDATEAAHADIRANFEKATNTKIPEGVNPVKFVYDKAGSSINQLQAGGDSFVNSSFFNRAASLEGKVSKAQVETYKQMFVDAKGNPLPGQTILNKLYAFKYGEGLEQKITAAGREARFKEGEKLEKEFNGWLMQRQEQAGLPKQPWQANARRAAEQVHVANAKDSLPTLFKDIVTAEGKGDLSKASQELDKEIWNLSKTPEGRSAFLKQLSGNIKDFSVKDRRVLWNNIKDNVKTNMIKDSDTFQRVSEIMTTASSSKEIARGVRLLERAAAKTTTAALSKPEGND